MVSVQLLLAALCLLVAPGAHDAFDLPKRLAAEVLVVASLVPLAWRLRLPTIGDLWSLPALRAVTPLLAVATASLLWSDHPLATREALVSLWIGAAALVGWSTGLTRERLRRLLDAMAGWAGVAAVLSILQFTGIFRPLLFLGGEESGRLGTGALVGNPGVLAGWLALAAVVAGDGAWRAWQARRQASAEAKGAATRRLAYLGGLLVVLLLALVGARVLAGLAAALAGGLVLGVGFLIAARERPALRRRTLVATAVVAVLVVAVVALAPPVTDRVTRLGRAVSTGDWNRVLSGRLDGWRTAAHLAAEHPLTGVGHGGYGAGFAEAKLALADRGVSFFGEQRTAVFVNAHNELLEVAAETGLLGLAALGIALWVVFRAARRPAPADRPLGWALLTVLALLCLAHFPFRVAATAYPAILALAWLLAASSTSEAREEPT